MKASHISSSHPLERAGFASEKFLALLFRRPGLQPRRKAFAFRRALAPEVRPVFPLIPSSRHAMKAHHESARMKNLRGNWESDRRLSRSDREARHKSWHFFAASAAEEFVLRLPHWFALKSQPSFRAEQGDSSLPLSLLRKGRSAQRGISPRFCPCRGRLLRRADLMEAPE
jgi:hypothetical protein